MTEIEQRLANEIMQYDVSAVEQSDSDEIIYSPAASSQIMALLSQDKTPARLTLRCDYNLARELRQKYESVVTPERLNPRDYITLLLVGQLSDTEVSDLIRHAFLASGGIIK